MNEAELLKRVSELESENEYLRSLLQKSGIKYDLDSLRKPASVLALPQELSIKHAQYFFSYFWGRMDVYSKRYKTKTEGKSGYFTQCVNFWKTGVCPKAAGQKTPCKSCSFKEWRKLEVTDILKHLQGSKSDESDVIGIYPMFPDNTCRLLVFDFDNHDESSKTLNRPFEEACALRETCKKFGFDCLVERSRSGKGAHVWLFFDSPIDATVARRFGFSLLDKTRDFADIRDFKCYDRMIPAQDKLPAGALGNLIALPLQGKALSEGNSTFIDENLSPYPDQWKVLLSTSKLSLSDISAFCTNCNNDLDSDNQNPWEGFNSLGTEDVDGKIEIVLSNGIYVRKTNLTNKLRNQIRHLAAFLNPQYYRNQAMGFSGASRYIYRGEDIGDYIRIPIGLLEQLLLDCDTSDIEYEIIDKRTSGKAINTRFVGELRENQKKAVSKLLQSETGILHAATAFGKTVVCADIIAERKVNTLIILESSSLVDQWRETLEKFLLFEDELPQYRTKSGRLKNCQSHIGIIQSSKDTSGGIVDIAMAGSLIKNGVPHYRLKDYGMIIVDECHHSATETIRKVLENVSSKYVFGVTATVAREDGLEKENLMLLGPVRYRFSAKERASEQQISHLVVPRFTSIVSPHGREKLDINVAYDILLKSEVRNKQIVSDIEECVNDGRNTVVLTKFKAHAENLFNEVSSFCENAFLLTGNISKTEQSEIRSLMNAVPFDKPMVLVATGQLIGEGFDYPRLDTLIMAMPVAWKGLVEQYAGRLNRDYEGKHNVMIYDYIDTHIPVFDKMYLKRLKTYKQIGYSLFVNRIEKTASYNGIYDVDSYCSIFKNDLSEACSEVVISSPYLSSDKVYRFAAIFKTLQERGVKVTVVTLHDDAYFWGSSEHRFELHSSLRDKGIHIELTDLRSERYAVIDNKIVWYGSINLLSKEDFDDSIMRLEDETVASELLKKSFAKDSPTEEF